MLDFDGIVWWTREREREGTKKHSWKYFYLSANIFETLHNVLGRFNFTTNLIKAIYAYIYVTGIRSKIKDNGFRKESSAPPARDRERLGKSKSRDVACYTRKKGSGGLPYT